MCLLITPSNLPLRRPHVGRAEIGLNKDDKDVGVPLEAWPVGTGQGLAKRSSNDNCHPLALSPFDNSPGQLNVIDFRTVGERLHQQRN